MMRILQNRNFIFALALALGLVFPYPSVWTQMAMIPALAIVMTLATINVPNDYFLQPRAVVWPSFFGIIMTYGVLAAVILGAATLFITNDRLWSGFVLIAAVPPAVAIIPFTAILDGDVAYSLSGAVASYLAALVVMPLVFLLFWENEFAHIGKLIQVMLLLIVLPLILSRIIVKFNLGDRMAKVRGPLTDWSFFIVLYSMIGVNRDLIFSQPLQLLPVAGVAFLATFALGFAIEKIGGFFNGNSQKVKSLVLLGTLKNQGIAGGLAIALLEKESALPSAVYSVFMILEILWLTYRYRKK